MCSGPTFKISLFCLCYVFLNSGSFCWPVNNFGLFIKKFWTDSKNCDMCVPGLD